MNQDQQLRERCAEILNWQKTGILTGNALRDYAKAKYGDAHNALQCAEADTAREAFAALLEASTQQEEPAASKPEPQAAQPEERVALTEEQKQAIWNEACKDSPKNPGWRRHLRYAEMLEAAHGITGEKE